MVATDAQITAALVGDRGPVVYRFRYERRTHGNAVVEDITDVILSCTIEMDNSRPGVWSAQFQIDASDFDFDLEDDHIGVTMELQVDGVFEDFQLGLFHLNEPEELHNPGGTIWSTSAVDLGVHLLEGTTSEPYNVPVSTNYISAVETVLDLVSLSHNIEQSVEVTPIDFTWAPETHWITIVNDLLRGINHYPIWSESDGIFTSRPRNDFADVGVSVDQPYTDTDMIVPPLSKRRPTKRMLNEAVVLIDDPSRAPFFSKVTNDDPNSPASTQSRDGTVVQEVFDISLALDEEMATTIAKQDVREAAWQAEEASLRTMIDPRRSPHELYTVSIPGVTSGVERWVPIGWELACDPEQPIMTHSLVKPHVITGFTIVTTSDIV